MSVQSTLNDGKRDGGDNLDVGLQAIAMARTLGDDAKVLKQLNNRAATRLILAQLREALADCQEVLQVRAPLTGALAKPV